MSTQYIKFTVIPPTAAMLAAHIDPVSGLVVDAVFDDAPDQPAIAAALPGATITWIDGDHARITLAREGPCLDLAAGDHSAPPANAHLDPGITLSLVGIPQHTDSPGHRARSTQRRRHPDRRLRDQHLRLEHVAWPSTSAPWPR